MLAKDGKKQKRGVKRREGQKKATQGSKPTSINNTISVRRNVESFSVEMSLRVSLTKFYVFCDRWIPPADKNIATLDSGSPEGNATGSLCKHTLCS